MAIGDPLDLATPIARRSRSLDPRVSAPGGLLLSRARIKGACDLQEACTQKASCPGSGPTAPCSYATVPPTSF